MGMKAATTSTFHQWVAHHYSSSLSQTLSPSTVSTPSKRRSIVNHRRSLSSRHTKTQFIRRAFSTDVDPFQVSNDILGSHNHDFSTMEPPWHDTVQMSSIERRANSVELPLSLRVIKRKLKMDQKEEVIKHVCGDESSAVKKAFSSMVFMIRELQSFTLHMRELLLFEDLRGILHRVRKEMHASFVRLFHQVFSATPTLMVSVMILLANFTVYSIGTNSGLATATPHPLTATVSLIFDTTETKASLDNGTDSVTNRTHEITEPLTEKNQPHGKFDSSVIKTFSVSSPTGGGSDGNNIPPVQSGSDGDGSDKFRTPSQFSSSSLDATSADSDVSVSGQEEVRLWNSILEESERMGALDHETMEQMVSPVEARVEAEESMDYFKTELLYQTGLSQQPDNVLLLANYAQFLYLIIHDYDRAEKYFKRAAKAEPADAEALNKYATFLWKARNDIWRAEETFLEAISADPTNSFYSANYAHFLWNTGGDETCFPLDAPP